MRQDSKDGRALKLAGGHGVPVAALRTLYDQVTADGGEVLRDLAEAFRE